MSYLICYQDACQALELALNKLGHMDAEAAAILHEQQHVLQAQDTLSALHTDIAKGLLDTDPDTLSLPPAIDTLRKAVYSAKQPGDIGLRIENLTAAWTDLSVSLLGSWPHVALPGAPAGGAGRDDDRGFPAGVAHKVGGDVMVVGRWPGRDNEDNEGNKGNKNIGGMGPDLGLD